MIPPAAVKTTLLHLFDVGSPSRMTHKEKQDTLRTLQKYLTNEIRGNSPVTLQVLHNYARLGYEITFKRLSSIGLGNETSFKSHFKDNKEEHKYILKSE